MKCFLVWALLMWATAMGNYFIHDNKPSSLISLAIVVSLGFVFGLVSRRKETQ
jgi:uncharacterized membrane protein